MRKYELKINDQTFKIQVVEFSDEKARLVVNDKPITVQVSGIEHDNVKSKVAASSTPREDSKPVTVPSEAAVPAASSGENDISAPIPGKVMEIFVKVGDAVNAGQPILKMEAMKMENVINTSTAGTIEKILVDEGEAVSQGQALILIR